MSGLEDEDMRALVSACAETHDEEIDCDAFLEGMAAYAEHVVGEKPLPASLEPMRRHERLCWSCREELGVLVDALRT